MNARRLPVADISVEGARRALTGREEKSMSENNELEKTLWAAADKLRSNMDAAEYKHIVLGLIFLKYISDAFNDLHNKLKAGKGEFEGANPEDADEYLAHNIFFVPEKARWRYLQDRAKNRKSASCLTMQWTPLKRLTPR